MARQDGIFRSNFTFLGEVFPFLDNIAQAAEYYLYTDPAGSLFKLRQFVERTVAFVFETHHLKTPYNDSLHNRIRMLEYEELLPSNIAQLFHTVKRAGNIAIHQNNGDGDTAFKIGKWFYQSYSEVNDDIANLKFSMPPNLNTRHALHVLEQEFTDLKKQYERLLAEKEASELPEIKARETKDRSERSARNVDLNEAETRELIDEQLRLAGWEADTRRLNHKLHKTLPQKGRNMAIAEWPAAGKWADYALFAGLKLMGIVEAKKYAQDISTDLRQSKIYVENIAPMPVWNWRVNGARYKVPFLFSTNGRPYLEQIKTKSGVWFLDVRVVVG